MPVVGYSGHGALRQAAGARPVHLAAGQGRRGVLTPAQLSMLLEGIDWRMPVRSWQPEMAG